MGEFEERMENRHLTLMTHLPDSPAIIYADGRRMWRILENLFGNILKYAMENTRVYAEVLLEKDQVIFTLKNISAQPLNIPAEELTERFIRGDVARNTEGSGLGLSIAQSLTQLQQIKRMLAYLGKPVLYLERVRMGNLLLDPVLERGAYRLLTKEEWQALAKLTEETGKPRNFNKKESDFLLKKEKTSCNPTK